MKFRNIYILVKSLKDSCSKESPIFDNRDVGYIFIMLLKSSNFTRVKNIFYTVVFF